MGRQALLGLGLSYPLRPTDFSPDYWISMGAAAITTLAGATLLSSGTSALVAELRPVVAGASVLFWAVASWWIPLLIVLDVWRHQPSQRQPLAVGAAAWGRVFPLGMYAMATLELADATGLAWLLPLSGFMLAIALLAWLLTGLSQLRQLVAGSQATAEDRAPAG